MAQITAYPSKDTPVVLDDTNNYDGLGTLFVGVTGESGAGSSFLQFDVSAIPAGATIDTAVLTIVNDGNGASNSTTFKAHLLTRSNWVEAEASWTEYSAGHAWTAGGGDYQAVTPTPASKVVANPSNTDIVFNDAGMVGLVQHAVDNLSGILDLLLKATVESGATDFFFEGYASENGSQANRPTLVVNYTEAEEPPGGGSRQRDRIIALAMVM